MLYKPDENESVDSGKLFVGGLSWETTVEKLSEYFARYGEVSDCVVMKNAETGRSRGFGFVTFKDPSCVLLVLSSGPHQLDDRTIDPKSCNAKSAQKVKREAKISNYPKVFLGGLPPDVNETVLREYFSKYGKVIEVVIMYDQERKKTRGNGFRGFGFLSYENDEAVNNVVSEHYVTINGKKVEVKRAEPREKTAPAKSAPPTCNVKNTPSPSEGQNIPNLPPVGHPSQTVPPNWWPVAPGHVAPPALPLVGVPPAMPPTGQVMSGPQGAYPPPGWAPQHPFGPGASWTPPAPGYQGYAAWPGYPSHAGNQPYYAAYPNNYYGQPGVSPLPSGPTPQPAPAPPPAAVAAPIPPPTQPYAQEPASYGPVYGAPATYGYVAANAARPLWFLHLQKAFRRVRLETNYSNNIVYCR